MLVTVLSTRPFDRGLLYTIGTAGTALAAFGVITGSPSDIAQQPVRCWRVPGR